VRLHRLEITGVGPFRQTQVIDFEPLMDAGLFLIDGPTGAGKTTIIDAITFALFGTTSGLDSDLHRMRSDHCTAEDPTEVVLDFSVRGRRHRIARSPEYQRATKRKTASGVTTQPARQTLIEFDDQGDPMVTLTAHGDIGVHVRDLLGMGSSQFRQMVVLPQGEFANLLRMSPKDRLQALAHLLGSDFFDQVQAELLQRAEQAREQRAASERRVEQARAAIVSRAAELPLVEKYVFSGLGEGGGGGDGGFGELVATVTTAADAAADEEQTASRQATQAQQHLDRMQTALTALQEYATARQSAEQALQSLGLADATRADLQGEQLREAERRGVLRPLADWEDGAAERIVEQSQREADVRTATAAVADIQASAAALPDELRTAIRDRDAAQALLDDEAMWRSRAAELDARVRAQDALAAARTLEEELATAAERATAEHMAAEQHLAAQMRIVTDLQAELLSERAASLAVQLHDGEPCPVCGACEHPHPAVAAGEHVGDAALDEAQAETARLTAEVRRLQEARGKADAAVHAHATHIAELTGRSGTASDLQVEHGAVTEQIDRIDAARRALPALAERAEELQERERTQGAALVAAQQQLATAEATLDSLREQHERRQAEIAATIDDHATAREALASTEQRLVWLDAAISALVSAETAKAQLPDGFNDPADAQRQFEEAERAHADAAKRAEAAQQHAVTLRNAAKALAQLVDEFDAALIDHQRVVDQVGNVIQLAEIAAARSSANQRKLTLASYAVQLRFAHVLEAASLHLERMSAGQYSFELNVATQGRGLAGLGITVLDSWTGQTRDPKTLSGGETFYASLALALGLADVVQSETGGAQLETLFVDEGFGSLDADTLQLVLDQLDQLRSGGRVVGVISHVLEMKERIPDRVDVIAQSDHTSVVRQDLTA